MNYIYIWLGFVVLFAVVEALTLSLTSIWFSVGALFAMVAATFRLSLTVQIVIFVVISAVILALTKPLMKKYSFLKNEKTNADRIINEIGYVTEEINNIDAKGQVKALGQIWSARSESGEFIPVGKNVRVLRIEGVKAFVTPIEEEK